MALAAIVARGMCHVAGFLISGCRKRGERVTFKVRSFRWEISQTSNFPRAYRRGKAPKPLLAYMFTAVFRLPQQQSFSDLSFVEVLPLDPSEASVHDV